MRYREDALRRLENASNKVKLLNRMLNGQIPSNSDTAKRAASELKTELENISRLIEMNRSFEN